MIAITLHDAETARAISAGMWHLSRPAPIAGAEGDVTRLLAPVVGRVLLADPDWVLPIHPQMAAAMADPAAGIREQLAALLGPLLADPGDLATAVALIVAGGALRVGDFIALLRHELVGQFVPDVEES